MPRWLRGIARRLRHAVHPPEVSFVHHPDYMLALPGVPVDPQRADRIVAFLLERGLIRGGDISRPFRASLANVERVHTREYLDSLDRPEALERILGFPISDEQRQQVIDYQRLLCGGTIHATRLALRGRRIAVNLGGGFHHALPDRGMGFSVLNDVAIAVRRLRHKGFDDPVVIVDGDLHDGNGTRAAFATDETVYTFSIHNATWDAPPAVADTCIALGGGVTDDQYLDVLRRELPPAIAANRPGLVIYVAGTDVAADDTLGNWKLTKRGILERDRFVATQARGDRGVPLVIVLGGGYGQKTWRYSARFFAWLLSGREVEPVEDVDEVVRRYRRLAVTRDAFRKKVGGATGGDGPDWSLTEEDLNLSPANARPIRVLGELSAHRLELALEHLGILAQIRALGFPAPVVAVDAASPVGDTIRIFGDASRSALLMELRLGRRLDLVPGTRTLYVEWLLLQDPREGFADPTRRLPGQDHPGLGMLREIIGWLVVLAESLELDGLAFTPAHYYMAALGRRHLQFARPEEAATFDAFRDAVAGLDLSAATRAIEEGRVIDERTGTPVRWHAPLMVLPLTEKLRSCIGGVEWEKAFLREREKLRFRLAEEGR
jgi:acetoin utilization deacetylase AcuC-like enzyme